MRALILVFTLIFSTTAMATDTVADKPTISKAVEETLSPRLAEKILSTPYDGFYRINGKMKRRGNYNFTKIKGKESFPDDRWETAALDVMKRLDFQGDSNAIGTRTRPTATAYVIMFKDGIEGIKHTGEGESLALVMINQQNAANPDMPTIKQTESSLYLMDLSLN